MLVNWLSVIIVSIFLSITTGQETADLDKYDTIVIGLGAAGTVAAATLAKAGRKVLALEAQDRVGGRVHTVPFGDGVVEVGGEWVQGSKGSIIYETAIQNNVTLLTQDLHYMTTKSDGTRAGAIIDELIEYVYDVEDEKPTKPEPAGDFMKKKLTERIKEKAPDVFENKKLLNRILDLAVNLICDEWGAYDANDLNAATNYADIEGHMGISWHRHGYKTFFELMLNKYKGGSGIPSLHMKLNKEVTKIEWPLEANGLVTVTTKDGTIYKADNVIITISLGVLKEKYKTLFIPPLPQNKQTAIEKMQMGLIGKIIFSFPSSWWPSKEIMYGFLWNEDDLPTNAEDQWTSKIYQASAPMGSSNTLTMWTSGDVTKQVEALPEEVVKEKALRILKRFMGANTTIPDPTGMIRSKWFSNEFTRGTYSYDRMSAADVPTVRADLAEPIKDATGKPCILFAGEASHPTMFATVHGAADTGRREAKRLLETQTS